jgi:hypothetical protein
MYKLPRELAIEWFDKRRQLDASMQPQQQPSGPAAAPGRTEQRRQEAWSFVRGGKQRQEQQPGAGPRGELSELVGDAQLPEGLAGEQQQQQQQQRRESVYRLTPKELTLVGWRTPALGCRAGAKRAACAAPLARAHR